MEELANTREAYNTWAAVYDSNVNPTRDLEGQALRQVLGKQTFSKVLEVGCGTGKNSLFFIALDQVQELLAVDLSEEMLQKAKERCNSPKACFQQMDLLLPWSTVSSGFDLISFSLVLEHIEKIADVFQKASAVLQVGGLLYLGEFHPFKQYLGSKARFETAEGTKVLACYVHHVSEFVNAAEAAGMVLVDLKEWFDPPQQPQQQEEEASKEVGKAKDVPRILTLLFRKL